MIAARCILQFQKGNLAMAIASVILSALWDVLSYNHFQIPNAIWHAVETGSAK